MALEGEPFQWRYIFDKWVEILPFALLLLVHSIVLLPVLLIRRKPWRYAIFSLLAIIFLCCSIFIFLYRNPTIIYRMIKFFASLAVVLALCIVQGNAPLYAQNDSDGWKRAMENYDFTGAISILDRQIDSLEKIYCAIQDSTALQKCSGQIKDRYMQKATCQKSLYKFSGAIESISAAIAIAGEDPAAFSSLADCHRLNGNDNAAMVFYSIATQLAPENIFFKIQKAALQYKMADYAGCIDEGRRIIAIDSIPAVLVQMGNSFNKLHQSDSALYYYSKVYPKNPADYRTLEKISGIYLGRKMYDTVIVMATSYLANDSANVVINPILGLALHGKKRYEESFSVFERSLELGCDRLSGYYYQGLNKLMMEEYKDAHMWFEKAHALDPEDVNLVYYMGYSSSYVPRRKNYADSLFYSAGLMLQPDSAMVHKINVSRGDLHFGYEDYRSAIKYYLDAEKYAPLAPVQLVKLGFAYRILKDYTNALNCYNRYFQVGRDGTASWYFAEKEVAFIKEEEFMNAPADK